MQYCFMADTYSLANHDCYCNYRLYFNTFFRMINTAYTTISFFTCSQRINLLVLTTRSADSLIKPAMVVFGILTRLYVYLVSILTQLPLEILSGIDVISQRIIFFPSISYTGVVRVILNQLIVKIVCQNKISIAAITDTINRYLLF
jgi:hypothetical protein